MKALSMNVGKVRGQGFAGWGGGAEEGMVAGLGMVLVPQLSLWKRAELGGSEVFRGFNLPCNSESVGHRVWAGLRAHGFQVSSRGWAQGKVISDCPPA